MIQWELRDLLDLNVMTVTGAHWAGKSGEAARRELVARNLGYLANYGLAREDVILPRESACETGSIAVLKGTIAPEGSVVKYAACAEEQRHFVGPARVFNHEEDAYRAVVERRIRPGDVIVIRYEGPRGCGMRKC